MDVVEAHHQAGDGGLAGAGVADDGCGLVGIDDEADAAEDPFDVGEVRRSSSVAVAMRSSCASSSLLVGEPDVAELDAA